MSDRPSAARLAEIRAWVADPSALCPRRSTVLDELVAEIDALRAELAAALERDAIEEAEHRKAEAELEAWQAKVNSDPDIAKEAKAAADEGTRRRFRDEEEAALRIARAKGWREP